VLCPAPCWPPFASVYYALGNSGDGTDRTLAKTTPDTSKPGDSPAGESPRPRFQGSFEITDPKTGHVEVVSGAELRKHLMARGIMVRPRAPTTELRRNFKKVENKDDTSIKGRNTGTDMDLQINKYSPKGRKLRKDFERPRPDLPAYADVNRNRKPITVTLPPDLLETVNERCRELNVDRTAFVEAAIRLALKPS